MSELNIFTVELFENLLDLKFSEINLDLHNDYEVKNILYKNNVLQVLVFHNTNKHNLLISFDNADIIEFDFLPTNGITIDNFYRGRFEFNNELFDEYNDKKCFYIDFCEIGQISVLCSNLKISEL